MTASLVLLLLLASACGCVSQGTYQKKSAEVASLDLALQAERSSRAALERGNESLRAELVAVRQQVADLKESGKELERLLAAKEDSSWQRLAQLEREKSRVSEELADVLRAREGKVRSVSGFYERILDTMAEELAGGLLTVAELRGTVRIAVADRALFAGDSSELTAQGSTILSKVRALLDTRTESHLTIEAYVSLSHRSGEQRVDSSSSWSLPVSRAAAVADGFLRLGITPTQLSTHVRGEFPLPGAASGSVLTDKDNRIHLLLELKE